MKRADITAKVWEEESV